MIKPGFGGAPFSLDRCRREPHNFGALLDRQAAKELHFNDSALLWIDLSQSFERVIKGNDVRRSLLRDGHSVIQCNLARATAALCVGVTARVIDQDAPHQLRGNSEEVGAVLPMNVLAIDQPE